MDDFRTDIQRIMHFVSAVRTIDSVFPAQTLHVLLAIAAKPGTSQRELHGVTKLSLASISRNVGALSTVNRKGEPGYGLVASVPSRIATNGYDIYLTAKGRDVLRRLLRAATGRPAEAFDPPTAR